MISLTSLIFFAAQPRFLEQVHRTGDHMSIAAETKNRTQWARIARDGLWSNNVVLAQVLALCPLLAVTGTATNGLGMGLATTAVLVASGLLISMLRGLITPEVRIPVFVLIIAVLVTLVDLGLNAWLHDLHKVLGLFIPLIVTNCAILGRAESFASRNRVMPAAFDGLAMGLGFTCVLVVLGAIREIIGSGTLFANAATLLGERMSFMEVTLIPDYRGFLLAILPPGGFLALGFMLAGKRLIDARIAASKRRETGVQAATA
jgi:electron transport complex protein RnfE